MTVNGQLDESFMEVLDIHWYSAQRKLDLFEIW